MNDFFDLGILLGGFFALVSVLVARENQVAIFRREWLNKTSEELEEFCMNARKLIIEISSNEPDLKFVMSLLEDVTFKSGIVRSRLNQKELLVKEMFSEMDGAIDQLFDLEESARNLRKGLKNADITEEELEYLERRSKVKRLLSKRAVGRFERKKYTYFKDEWNRLKEGEFFTKLSYYGCGMLVVLLVLKIVFGFFS